MEKLTTDQRLNFEFANLKIDGSNIEEFYNYRYKQYAIAFAIRELPKEAKIRVTVSGKLFGKNKIFTNEELPERDFIDDQITKCEGYLKEPIRLDNRVKLNIWVDYLKLKQKAIIEIQPEVPDWTQPLIALYFVYKGDIQLTEKNRAEYAKQLKTEISPDAVRLYGEYLKRMNRTFTDLCGKFKKDDTRKANEMRKRLLEIKIIFESRGESVPDQLISDIETLNKNLKLK